MTVATRLRGAFLLYIGLMAGVVVYHVRTIQATERAGQEVTAISSRLRVVSTEQVSRLNEMGSDAEKFLITRDEGYLEQFRRLAREFGAELRRLDAEELSPGERAQLEPLLQHWREVELRAAGLAVLPTASRPVARDWMDQFTASLDELRDDTRRLAAAAQEEMQRQLDASDRAARAAERVSLIAAVGALLLVFVLSAWLMRSIVGPLRRLAQGTREVSAGRFEHRLDERGSGEFAQMASDFNAMTERLDELDRMKREFVAKVSHDLKTPLTSMQETIGILLDQVPGPLTDKQRQLLELNRESAVRLSAMLTKLLDLSRIEAGLEPDLQMLDVVQLLGGSVAQAGLAHARRGVTVTLEEPPCRLLVRGDAVGLAQVMDNLIENAVKFSPAGGTVRVSATSVPGPGGDVPPARWRALRRNGLGGGAVLLAVADDGPGVPDEEKQRIFERFYQTEGGRAVRGRGVGLGLTICKEIVARHGGTIWVRDHEPRGSIFCVLLPGAVRVQDDRPAAQPTEPAGAPA